MTGSDLDLANAHKYRLLNGDVAVNVTKITGMLDDSGKSSRMAGAAAKIAKAGGNYRAEWKDKMDRGTRIHNHCEHWLRGEPIEAMSDEMGYLDALEQFFITSDVEPIMVERVVLSSKGFGGRFDFIATVDGQSTLVDVKTGKPYPLEHTLQLSAYRYADGVAVYGEDGNLARLESLPPIERAGCLYLADDGEFTFQPYPADELAFAVFCDLLGIHKSLAILKEGLAA